MLQVTLFTHKTRHQNVFQAANNTIYAEEIEKNKAHLYVQYIHYVQTDA